MKDLKEHNHLRSYRDNFLSAIANNSDGKNELSERSAAIQILEERKAK